MGADVERGPEMPEGIEELRSMADLFQPTLRTAEDLAEAFVREAINRGVFRPGDRLPQDSIANILGISRIPVRAGMRQLQAEGLLTIHPHRGATVRVLRPEDIKEIYDLRTLVECDLIEKVMPHITPERLAELRKLAAELDESPPSSGAIMQRIPFYEHLYSLANQNRALRLVSRLHSEVGGYLVLQSVVEEPFSSHSGLLDCLEKGDVEGARSWLRKHLAKVSEQLQVVVRDMQQKSEL
ncbi:MAG: transcriptional regulator, GntR family [Acidimicrobiaceae bacterium]|nr:transcriptional regulator, GntR family [Acidimicrobiaceae bacterium]